MKIQKGQPIPKMVGNKKYPFEEMEVGDMIEGDRRLQMAAYQYARRNNLKFLCKAADGRYSVWRVE